MISAFRGIDATKKHRPLPLAPFLGSFLLQLRTWHRYLYTNHDETRGLLIATSSLKAPLQQLKERRKKRREQEVIWKDFWMTTMMIMVGHSHTFNMNTDDDTIDILVCSTALGIPPVTGFGESPPSTSVMRSCSPDRTIASTTAAASTTATAGAPSEETEGASQGRRRLVLGGTRAGHESSNTQPAVQMGARKEEFVEATIDVEEECDPETWIEEASAEEQQEDDTGDNEEEEVKEESVTEAVVRRPAFGIKVRKNTLLSCYKGTRNMAYPLREFFALS